MNRLWAGATGVLVALACASPAAARGLSFPAAKNAIARDMAQRTLQASWDASFELPTTTTTDEAGHQNVEYTKVKADSALKNCVRVSARRVRCDWRLWVAIADTGRVVARESGTSVATLRVARIRYVDVSAWIPEARRRGLGDY